MNKEQDKQPKYYICIQVIKILHSKQSRTMCLGVSLKLGGTGVDLALEHCDATGVDGGVGVTMPLGRVLERAIPLGARDDGKLFGFPPPPFHLR